MVLYQAAKNKLKVKMKELRAKKADEAAAAGPLVGKRLRIISPEVGRLLQNQVCKCLKHWQADGEVLLERPGSQGGVSTLRLKVAGTWTVSEFEKLKMPERLDLRTVTGEEKLAACSAAGNQIQALMDKSMMDSPELTACWHEVLARASRAKDILQPGEVCLLDPQASIQ